MKDCVLDSGDKWSSEIDKNIKLLKSILNSNQYEQLTEAQKAWIKYKDIQQSLNLETISAKTGTMYIDILSAEQVGIIKRRAQELSGLYFILKQ